MFPVSRKALRPSQRERGWGEGRFSLPAEVRFSPFGKGRQTLDVVATVIERSPMLLDDFVSGAFRQALAFPKRSLGSADGERRIRGDFFRQPARFRVDLLRRDQMIDQTEFERFPGGNLPARVNHGFRVRRTDQARQPNEPAGAGEDADLHFRKAEHGIVPRDPDVASDGKLRAAGQGIAANRGNDRNRKQGDRVGQRINRFGVSLSLGSVHVATLVEIGAGAKGEIARPGDDERSYRPIFGKRRQLIEQAFDQRHVERIPGRWSIERYLHDSGRDPLGKRDRRLRRLRDRHVPCPLR